MPFQKGHSYYPNRAAKILASLTPPRRWLPDDFDDWLAGRFMQLWGRDEGFWRTRCIVFTGSNDFLFITNEDAVLLARQQKHSMTGQTVVYEEFAWARAATMDNDQYQVERHERGEHAIKGLYRHALGWAESLKAQSCVFGMASDIQGSWLRESFTKSVYLVRVWL